MLSDKFVQEDLSSNENLSKQIHYANFSDAQDAPGRRELPVVKF